MNKRNKDRAPDKSTQEWEFAPLLFSFMGNALHCYS